MNNQNEFIANKKRMEVEIARYKEIEARREVKDKPDINKVSQQMCRKVDDLLLW